MYSLRGLEYNSGLLLCCSVGVWKIVLGLSCRTCTFRCVSWKCVDFSALTSTASGFYCTGNLHWRLRYSVEISVEREKRV